MDTATHPSPMMALDAAEDMRAVVIPNSQLAEQPSLKQASPFLCVAVAEAAAKDLSPFAAPTALPPGLLQQQDAPRAAAAAASRTTSSSTQAELGSGVGGSSRSSSSQTQQGQQKKKRVTFSAKLFSCMCIPPADEAAVARASADGSLVEGGDVVLSQAGGLDQLPRLSPRRSVRGLHKYGSAAYSDADWFDARSEFSSALSSAASDQAAKLEELTAMLREQQQQADATEQPQPALAAAAASVPVPVPATGLHVPNPPLAFAEPGLVFVPVPAVTGFAAYWERDAERSTAHPTPIDILTNASSLAQRSHESIPGIWLQEGGGQFTVTVKPRFMPPGLPRYTETYDKSNATEPSWNLRRDLRLGSTSGQIFMTACGMLILRARSKPLFGGHDYVMEEYMRLEDDGAVIVDRMCCMDLKTGQRATQYIVGHRHEVPPKGHV